MTSHARASELEPGRSVSRQVVTQRARKDPAQDPRVDVQALSGREVSGELGARTASGHARLLRRAERGGGRQAQEILRQMQRAYGNRYARKVTDIALQGQGEAEVAPEIEQAIGRKRGGGQALDSGVLAQMEPAFGADFGGVRVHTDGEADRLNHSLSARAFTTGRDIFFRQGSYSPGSSSGRELLAHELTHVVQQGGGVRSKLTVSQPGDIQEQEADQVAKAVVEREQQQVHRQEDGRQLQRQLGEEEEEEVRTKAEDPWVQRQVEPEEEEEVPT